MTDRSAGTRQKTKAPEPTPIAAYKALLRSFIDRRPSGMRAHIAAAIGKHKSFVSQLTNPIYPMPIPARHLPTIFDICRFSPEERRVFLKAYLQAHPERGEEGRGDDRSRAGRKTLTVDIPDLGDPKKQHALESLIQEFVERIAALIG